MAGAIVKDIRGGLRVSSHRACIGSESAKNYVPLSTATLTMWTKYGNVGMSTS